MGGLKKKKTNYCAEIRPKKPNYCAEIRPKIEFCHEKSQNTMLDD